MVFRVVRFPLLGYGHCMGTADRASQKWNWKAKGWTQHKNARHTTECLTPIRPQISFDEVCMCKHR